MPVTVEPSIHGAPDSPSTSPPQAATGTLAFRSPMGAVQLIGPPPTPMPVSGDGDDRRPVSAPPPSASPPPRAVCTESARGAAHSRDREVGLRVLGRHPPRVQVDGVDVPDVTVRRGVVEAGDEVASIPSATQCAAVRIRSPAGESSTAALHVCSAPPPRNRAPTVGLGGTGCGGRVRHGTHRGVTDACVLTARGARCHDVHRRRRDSPRPAMPSR